jgi:ribulose-phosphate 3-epimerase
VIASILGADFGHLQAEVDSLEAAGADRLQIDVMDGHFVPNLTFGLPALRGLQTKLPLDLHLMVSNPAEHLAAWFACPDFHIANVTFHAEAVPTTADRQSLITAIRAGGATAGIALNPDTPASAIEDIVRDVDLVLVMTVQPGFSGQAFRADVLPKLSALRTAYPQLSLQVDGGINAETGRLCRSAGATQLVAASSLLHATDRAALVSHLRA